MRPALLAFLLALIPSLLLAAEPTAAPAPLFDDNGAQLTVAQFVEKYIPADMPVGLGRKEVQAALEDAGANWVELAKTIQRCRPDLAVPPAGASLYLKELIRDSFDQHKIEDLAWLITAAPHLDRLELTDWILEDAIDSAVDALVDRGSEPYRRFFISYRFDDEPVTDWRSEFVLNVWMGTSEGGGDVVLKGAPIQKVVDYATNGFTIIDRGYFGNLSDPVSLLHSRAGTKRELSILVAAALRSQGYATRFVRENRSGESWVEVYSGDPKQYDASKWTPVYPTAPDKTGDVAYATELCGGRICVVTAGDAFGREQVTSRYTTTGAVVPLFYDNDPVSGEGTEVKDFTGWAFTAWNDQTGSFVPLDDLEYPSSDKDYPLDGTADSTPKYYVLGPGQYRLECGVRYPGGISHVQVQEFGVTANQSMTMAAYLMPPTDLPQAALVEREIDEFVDSPRLMHQGRYVFLVGDGGEPSLRALNLLKPLESRSSVYFQHWRMVGATDEDRAFVKDVLKVDETKDTLPVAIVVVDGKTTMYLQGYNLNVAQWVERALEGGNGS
jgi:hypothetical protein